MKSDPLLEDKLEKAKEDEATYMPLFHPLARRFHIILLLIFGFGCTTFMRVHMAITMTCMVNSTAVSRIEEQIYDEFLFDGNVTELFQSTSAPIHSQCSEIGADGHHVVVDYGGSLPWTHEQQNLVFSGSFWGALVIALPAMKIVQEGSPKYVLLTAMILYVSSSAVTPFVATTFGALPTFFTRVIMGFGEGVVIPTINAIISNWFPINERSTALALFTTGNQLAGAGGTPLAGGLCASSFGWQSIFYFCTIMGTIWCVLWTLFSASRPSACKVMTKREREYLSGKVIAHTKKKVNTPYKKILTSLPFWAQLQSHFVINMMMTLLQLYLPTFLKDILRLGVVMNGAFVSLPNICNFLTKICWGIAMDYAKTKKILSPTFCVKLSQSIANFGVTIGFICIALFVDCTSPGLALFLFCAMYCCLSTFTSGFYTSLLSLAPRYTATMSAFSQFAAMIGRVCTPIVVGFVKHQGTHDEWKTLFYLTAGGSFISGLIFAIFGSGDIQDWARDDVVQPTEEAHIALAERAKSVEDLDLEMDLED